MNTLPIALVLCGLSGIGLAGCQTVEDDGYGYGPSYSTVEYGVGYGRSYDYDSGYRYREPVRRPPPRYVERPYRPGPVWGGGGQHNPPPVWNGGGRPPQGGGGRPPQYGGDHRPPPSVPWQGRYKPEAAPATSDVGR